MAWVLVLLTIAQLEQFIIESTKTQTLSSPQNKEGKSTEITRLMAACRKHTKQCKIHEQSGYNGIKPKQQPLFILQEVLDCSSCRVRSASPYTPKGARRW
jgi:hypothetical protein